MWLGLGAGVGVCRRSNGPARTKTAPRGVEPVWHLLRSVDMLNLRASYLGGDAPGWRDLLHGRGVIPVGNLFGSPQNRRAEARSRTGCALFAPYAVHGACSAHEL